MSVFVFYSYSHRDKALRNRLDEHLSNLKYRNLITTWYDQEILGGEDWSQIINEKLNKAHIILLLISPGFMSSGYCYGIEMKHALERYERKEAQVIPILLRAVHFTGAPFEKLQILPSSRRPVSQWRDRDSAFVEIARGIESAAVKYPLISEAYLDFSLAELKMRDNKQEGEGEEQESIPESIVRSLSSKGYNPRTLYYFQCLIAYQDACRRNPFDILAYQGKGSAFYALGEYQSALESFQKAIKLNPTAAAYSGLARTYWQLKHYEEAVGAFETAVQLDPEIQFNSDGYVEALKALGKTQEAKQVIAQIHAQQEE